MVLVASAVYLRCKRAGPTVTVAPLLNNTLCTSGSEWYVPVHCGPCGLSCNSSFPSRSQGYGRTNIIRCSCHSWGQVGWLSGHCLGPTLTGGLHDKNPCSLDPSCRWIRGPPNLRLRRLALGMGLVKVTAWVVAWVVALVSVPCSRVMVLQQGPLPEQWPGTVMEVMVPRSPHRESW